MRRAAPALVALPLYGISRALPPHGFGLWLRLLAATLVVLLPGIAVARALRLPRVSGTVVWTLGVLTVGFTVTALAHTSLWLTLGLTLGAALVAFVLPRLGGDEDDAEPRAAATVALGGLALGGALWFVAGVVHGDALFHLARVRKLDAFGSLSLHAVDEFRDGGLHPGYAFPLWHVFLALVARLADVDPSAVVAHEASVLAPVACLVWYEAGTALFRSAWLGAAVVAAQVTLVAVAPGNGGAFAALALPANAATQLLVPAAVALAFGGARPVVAIVSMLVAGGALALVHPTYAVFLLVVLGAYVAARAVLAPRRLGVPALATAALAVGSGVVLAWLAPLARKAAAESPSRAEVCKSVARYRDELVGSCAGSYHLAPEVLSRRGAVAVGALLLVPLAALAGRRRWGALVLGATTALLAVELLPWLFPGFASLVSISQARRAAGFVPFAFALAGGAAVLAAPLRLALPAAALAAGIALQLIYPGAFGDTPSGGPAWPAWVAGIGGAAALVLAAAWRRLPQSERRGVAAAAAVAVFALPAAVHGFSEWSASASRDPYALTPGVVRFLRERVPKRAVVFSDLETSYRIAAAAPVYVTAAPPAHVADTPANRPQERRRAVIRFLSTGDLAIPRRFGAGVLVVALTRPHPHLSLRAAYRDARFAVYRLSSRS